MIYAFSAAGKEKKKIVPKAIQDNHSFLSLLTENTSETSSSYSQSSSGLFLLVLSF